MASSYILGKGPGPPLAFRCIKSYGGIVPMTLVGVTRVYPLLYKERYITESQTENACQILRYLSCRYLRNVLSRFPNGGSVVRSERMERKALQLCQQRYSLLITLLRTVHLFVTACLLDFAD